MNKTIGFQLAIYSLLLAGLSYLTHHLAPSVARPTLVAGLAGGALCLVWGVRAVAGSRSKALPILTLIPICFVMLSQVVMNWGGGQDVPGQSSATPVMAILLVLSMGMLVRIAYAGVVFRGPAGGPAKDGGAKAPMAGKAGANSSKAQRI
jgi:hypothetical protein